MSNFDGNIELSGGLGLIKFAKSLVASGHILFMSGGSIKAGGSIEAVVVVVVGGGSSSHHSCL